MSKETAMQKLVKAYHASGASQKSFAATHGISKGKLNYWIQKLSNLEEVPPDTEDSSFIPIEVNTLSKETPSLPKVISIRLTSGVEIEIPL